MITTFYPPHHFGGDAGYVRQLSKILGSSGHEVDVIHDLDAFRILSKESETAATDQYPGVTIHGMGSRLPRLSCLATHQFARPVFHGSKIRRILDERKPDIIHFHNVSLVGGPGVLAYGDAMKIYTAHEHWLVCPTHVLWRNNRELCDEKRCLKCSLIHKRPPQLWRSTDYLQRKAAEVDQFCSFSEFSVEMHRKFGFKSQMKVLPSFTSDVDFESSPPPPEQSGKKPYFLFVGRLEKIKGVQDIIPVFRDRPDAQLWIIGSGYYEPVLRKLAAGSGNIRFLGQREPGELRSFYTHAVAVLLPSICYEVFPMVVLEAFREGIPVICRDLGPFPEIVRKSGGGLLFASREDLQKSIHHLIRDKAARAAMGKSARKSFVEYWSEPAGMRAYCSLIREIASRRKQRKVLAVLDRCDEYGQLI